MSEQELRDELMTALVAGHETTASQLAWALERLAREPAARARLTDEIDAGESDEYLSATITEILRLRPVLPNAEPRLTKREVEIGGHRYPPGVVLMASAYLIHHDPDIYPEPRAFRPERFVGRLARDLHLDPVRRWAPALPGRELRRAGDEGGPARDAAPLRDQARPRSARRRRGAAASPSAPRAGRRSCCAGARRWRCPSRPRWPTPPDAT